jgi:hypothetical protein
MPSSKAAANGEARRTGWYVEPLHEARTPLADFLSILLGIITKWRQSVKQVDESSQIIFDEVRWRRIR